MLAGLALALSACGSSGDSAKTPPPSKDSPAPSPLDPRQAAEADVAVIQGWTDALRRGRVAQASGYFALPAVVSNGTAPLRLTTRGQVRFFNRALPCGARFKSATDTGAYVVATLVLTERPGPGRCGSGVGNEAHTAFLIRRGRIVQWRRVIDPPPAATPDDQAS